MSEKGFDLSALLKNVSAADTGEERIESIQIDQIDPDPENFYSLENLDELAWSIETVGLQQPLRVRPGEAGHYTVVSGHRRRAAILLIRDGGSTAFDSGVPCIVERGPDSPALRKLKLLLGNSATRKMTSADLNRQTEELEDALRELQDEGFTFPGRMRDWVAELTGLSRTKLARLKVIRDSLAPDIRKAFYEPGSLSETSAYELAKLDADAQRWAVDLYRETHHGRIDMQSYWPGEFEKDRKAVAEMTCKAAADGGPCTYQKELMSHLYRAGWRGYDCLRTGCCHDCDRIESCTSVCPLMRPKRDELRARSRADKREIRERETAAKTERTQKIAAFWSRFGQALRRSGKSLDDLKIELGIGICNPIFNWNIDDKKAAALMAGNADAKPDVYLPADRNMDLEQGLRLVALSDALGCSLDFLLLRSEIPEVNTGTARNPEPPIFVPVIYPEWRPGTPNSEGRYICLLRIPGAESLHEQKMEWTADGWQLYGEPLRDGFRVEAWWPLPQREETEI